MKVGLCTIAFKELALEDVIDIAAKMGFDGVEIWGKEPHMSSKYDARYVRHVRKMVRDRRLEIACFGSYVKPVMEQYRSQWKNAFQITQGLGTKIMRIWPGGGPSKLASSEERSLIASRLRELCEKAQNFGITLAMEMHSNNLTDTADSTVRLIENVGVSNLRTYYQPSFRADSNDPYECLKKTVHYVVNVHAQNAKIHNGEKQPCPIPDGVVDYRKIIKTLKSFGYDGYLEVEFVRGDNKIKALKRDHDFLAGLVTDL